MRFFPQLRSVTRHRLVGVAEYFVRPGIGERFGGPFNGQEFRRRIFRELVDAVGFDAVIECGTYRGTTTGFLQQTSGVEVDTIEADARLFGYCQRRFARDPSIRTHHSDSRAALRRLVAEPRLDDRQVFAYLDAHWREDLPLRDELEILFTSTAKPVALVDDFRVPGDDGYTYDDYGPGKRLEPEYLDQLAGLGLRRFYPAARSDEETGCRRGSVVIAAGRLADVIAARCSTLREQTPAAGRAA